MKWKWLDYTHDEAANARLLEAMVGACISVTLHNHQKNYGWSCAFVTKERIYEVANPDRKTAIRDAFCRVIKDTDFKTVDEPWA